MRGIFMPSTKEQRACQIAARGVHPGHPHGVEGQWNATCKELSRPSEPPGFAEVPRYRRRVRLRVLIALWALSGCTVVGLGIGGAVTKSPETTSSPAPCLERHRQIEAAHATADPVRREHLLETLPACEPQPREPGNYATTGAVVGLVVDIVAAILETNGMPASDTAELPTPKADLDAITFLSTKP